MAYIHAVFASEGKRSPGFDDADPGTESRFTRIDASTTRETSPWVINQAVHLRPFSRHSTSCLDGLNRVSLGSMQALRVIFAVLWWIVFGTVCAVFFVGATIIFLITYLFDPNRKILHLYSCVWAQMMFYINPFWNLEVKGRDQLPWNGPGVIVANHESSGDILVVFGLYRPFKWVAKSSVFRAPFLGWNMTYNGYIPIVRGSAESRDAMNARCEAYLERGVPILMFPEGTRSKDGEIQPFKDGAFRLATRAKCPVYPVVISGTSQTLPKHGLLVKPVAHCRVHVLSPVHPSDFDGDHALLREHVHGLIVEEKRRMRSLL